MQVTPFSERTIAQAAVLLRAQCAVGARPVPLKVEMAVGINEQEGWKAAALDYLMAKAEGRRYDGGADQPDWDEFAGEKPAA